MSSPRSFALEELLAHASWARDLALHLLGDPGASEDCLQETWIAALLHPPLREGSPRAWLRRVLVNFALQRRRGEGRRAYRETRVASKANETSPHDIVQRVEVQRILAEEVLALEEPYRTTVVLHYYEGQSSAEIARSLGLPSATVRSRLRRALEMLRGRLDERREGGDSWRSLLAVFAGSSRRVPQGAGVTSLASTPQVLGTLALVLLGGVLAWNWALRDRTALVPLDSLAERRSALLEQRVLQEPTVLDRSAVAVDLPHEPQVDLDSRSSGGWWLEASVRTDAGTAVPGARVRVAPTALLGGGAIEGLTDDTGTVELDLSRLFLAREGMPLVLFLRAEHPDCVPGATELELTREQRQGGFRAGESVRLRSSCTLTPARASVRGRVVGERARAAVVALYSPPPEDCTHAVPSDVVRVAEDGSFLLRVPAAGAALLIAAPLAPADGAPPSIVRRFELAEGEHAIDLEWEEGAAIEGRLALAGGRVGERCRITARPVEPASDAFFGTLAWNGTRLESVTRSSVTDAGGGFCLRGLAATRYEVGFESACAEGDRPTPMLWLGGRPEGTRVTVTAPALGLELEEGELLARFVEVWRDGEPLQGARIGRDPRDPWSRSDASGRMCVCFREGAAAELVLQAPPSAPFALHLEPPTEGLGPPVRIELPGLGPRAQLALEVAGDPARELEAAVLELFVPGTDVARAIGPRDAVWLKRERRMQEGFSFDDLPAGRWMARLVPTGPGPDAGDERSFCEEIFELDLAPAANERLVLALRRGGWLRVLAGAIADSGTAAHWCLRDAAGVPVPVRLVHRRHLATLPVTDFSFGHELETPAALLPGEYLLEVESADGAPFTRSFRIEAGRTTTLESQAAR